MSVEEVRNNINNTQDILRRIIKVHSLDTVLGNDNREDLNYVDVLYPYVEKIFGLDACLASINDKNSLRSFYEENYELDVSYDKLLEIFNGAKEICESLTENNKLLNVSDDLEDVIKGITDRKIAIKATVK